ncbi:Alpha/Beta hydrolase protein [Talaromyces proteolyticus]|uniref:Alpha/Beta hydrolase protein n=1 Tax=Talaromyces proteolyticus TaxID=1131652 RepID=A0AAD4KF14_9EURO|nr:Alpha/Beta hydrolase protein [Talaromyces proteolyticus]KAH8688738.1 Alpha/Beta hydrolase protein [Talaromyces proteolyticus]
MWNISDEVKPSNRAHVQSLKRKIAAACPPVLPKKRLSVIHRLNCFLQLWLLKIIAATYFFVRRLFINSPFAIRPTLVKRYTCRLTLEVRIFFPPDYEGNSRSLLPLYFNIHGGGFAVCDAQIDDRFCTSWAKRTGMLVVSLNYTKAPLNPFPAASYDIAAVIKEVLEDASLPVDKSRVAIGGFSAGGNLALSATQLPWLKGIIKAAVVYYPIVDFSHPPDVKLAAKPYTNSPPDTLEKSSWIFDWGYVSNGQNRRDPLLSPCYAKREDLPPWIYMVGAEWDMLRLEAQVMIHHLAGLVNEEDPMVDAFEKGNYKWTVAKGCSHGFTHDLGGGSPDIQKRRQTCEMIYQEAYEWLERSVLGCQDGK